MTITAEVIATGLYFGEGPRWHDGRLWFSDFFAHAVKTCSTDGLVETVFTVDGRTSGLGWLPDGSLLVVSMIDQQLLRWTAGDVVPTPYASLAGAATFHCNDMVVLADGTAFVGNFGFDLDAWEAEHGFVHVLRHSPATTLVRVDPAGGVHIAATDLRFPNGMAVTPDGATLIVAETFGGRLTAFDLAADGTLSNRRVWADLGERIPDGICLDAEGQVWVACPPTRDCILVAEGGEVLEVVSTSERCFACMLGGDDGRTLFLMTSRESDAQRAAAEPTGKIETARAAVAHAGRP